MQYRAPAGFQAAFQCFEIARPISLTDRFEHLDGNDAVELAFDIAIVLEPEIGMLSLVGFLRCRLCPIQLGWRKGEAGNVGIRLGREVNCKRAPAAANLQYALTAVQLQFVDDAVEFFELGRLERRRRIVENRRRIEHRGIEPLPVEFVAEIVMGLDVAAAAALCIGVQPVAKTIDEAHGQATARRSPESVVVLCRKTDQGGQIRCGPVVFDVTLGKTDVAI
ncbi:hypothetical protein D3C72_1337660 [compost metagenome]